MEIETWKVANLTLDPNNARKHDQKNLDAIKASLEKFGQRKPIVITTTGTVLAGNGTLEAAIELGWKELTVAVAPKDWDSDTAKAYALADNRTAELAQWDTSVLLNQIVELDATGWEVKDFGFEKPKHTEMPDFQPDTTEQPRLDQRAATICPSCAFEWRVGAKGEIEPA